MAGLWNAIRAWFTSDPLDDYPQLKVFKRESALRRLWVYEKEERKASRTWFRWLGAYYVAILLAAVALKLIPGTKHLINPIVGLVFYLPAIVVHSIVYRRTQKRVAAKVAAELSGGRLKTCFECGYDLRGTTSERCSECGAIVVVRGFEGRIPDNAE